MRCIRDNKGSATILMALIAGVIVTVGLGFNWLVKEHLKASEGLKNKTEAIIKARSAYDTVIYQILNGRMGQREVLFTGGQEFSELKALPLDNRKVSAGDDVYIQAQDSNGMLSLAMINEAALRRLIRKAGEPGNVFDPVDSLIDWIDADDFTRTNGAEAFYYRGEGLPYTPRNYPLQYKEEVAMIKGIDGNLHEKIKPYVTLLPAIGFNPNTASDAVLMSYLDIGEDAVKALRAYLAVKPISSDGELFPLTGRRLMGEEGVYYYPSYYLDITVSVGQPRSYYTIRSGLHMMQNPTTPYSALYWIEE